MIQSNGVLPQYPPPLMPDGRLRGAEQPGEIRSRRRAAGGNFIRERHLPDPRSTHGVLDVRGDDVTDPHHAATHPCSQSTRKPGWQRMQPNSRCDPPRRRRNEKPDLAPTRRTDDKPGPRDGPSNDREAQEIDELPAPRPRWPLLLVGLFVAIFAATVLFIIFRPRSDIRTSDAYVMVHYATIAPRISGQIATVPVDDNDVVKAGQVLATLDPRDNETALASAEAAVARDQIAAR